jgi:hypothetical protein
MKIEIADPLFEQYRQLIMDKFHSEDVGEYVERLDV